MKTIDYENIDLQSSCLLCNGKERNAARNDIEWLNQKGIEVLPNDLHLMDLGYYKLAHLSKIASLGAIL